MSNPVLREHLRHAGRYRSFTRFAGLSVVVVCLLTLTAKSALAQATTFAGNAQHTSSYAPLAQTLEIIKWTANIDLNNTGALIHYGAPGVVEIDVGSPLDDLQLAAERNLKCAGRCR